MDKRFFSAFLLTTILIGIFMTSACTPLIQAQPIPTATTQETPISDADNDNIFETQYYNLNTPLCDCPADSNEHTITIVEKNLPENINGKNVRNPYVFTLNGKDIDFSIGHMEIKFDEGLLTGESTNFDVVSPENLGTFTTTSEALAINSKTGVIRSEKYGNLLLSLHSGYTLSEHPLEAEFLRYSLEKWGNNTEYVEKKLYEIIGSKGTITFDGVEFQIEITGAIRLQKDESDEINSYPENVLDIATKSINGQYVAMGNTEPFEKAKFNHELMINFCGWGPNNQPTYYRYIILIDIKEET